MWVKDEDGDYCNLALMKGVKIEDRGDDYALPFQVKAFDLDSYHILFTCKLEEHARSFLDEIMEPLRIKK